ncbi:MAG: dethiobiotin synthase [Angustibacter sp.]
MTEATRGGRILLVTGTGTEVGKTVVTAAIASCAAAAGRRAAVVKVAQTGVAPGQPGDVHEVARLAGVRDIHELARLPDPLAPRTAARIRGLPLPSLQATATRVRELAAQVDVLLAEGAGGVLVELDAEGRTLLDLATDLDRSNHHCGRRVAAVVVASAGLGTLNHTALTTRALRDNGTDIAGVVVGRWPSAPGLAERCNLEDLPRVTGVPLLGRIPDGAGRLTLDVFASQAPGWLHPRLGGNAPHEAGQRTI